jgi:chloramphenicol-sensitive protein RarD
MAVAERFTVSGLTEPQKGVLYLVVAHLIWGAMAYYVKLLEHVSPAEVAVHRGLWALPVAAGVLVVIGGRADLVRALRTPRVVLILFFCSALVVFNWGFYVWAIEQGRAAEAALGYYVNPLMNLVVGFLFLGERFTRAQTIAVVLVVVAVAVQTVAVGSFPWLGLSLAATFCLYGFIRKKVQAGAVQGFFIEVLLFAPFALAYLAWHLANGTAVFLSTATDTAMLIGLGIFTASTLMLFSAAVRRIRYSTVGLLQYISPSIVFLIAVFVFHEPMNPLRWFSFVLIWIGLAVFSWSALHEEKSRKALERAATSAAEPV